MRRRILFTILLAVFGTQVRSLAAGDRKQCVFLIEIVKDGGGMSRPGDTRVGDRVCIYEHEGGWLTGKRHEAWHGLIGPPREAQDDLFGGGAEFTARIRSLFREAAIHNFDYGQAIEDARKKGWAEKKILALVGPTTVSVFADLEGTRFSFTAEGLGASLEFYAPYSAELQKLKLLLDGIAYEYGRHRIFL
jgi:hypothetical protein